MKRTVITFLTAVGLLTANAALAQESGPTAGSVEVTVIPGGGTFFLKGSDTGEPAFGNYDLGAAVGVNFNRFIGVEGEVGGALGISQTLEFPASNVDLKSPNIVQYSGNLVVSAANRSPVVPYVTGGVGGLSVFDKPALGIAETKTFLTGNVGGGVKWYAGRWGLRGDYRFLAVRSQDNAPDFFGKETRYGHRVYGGVVLNLR
jgi:opacity protein-like surface antigen